MVYEATLLWETEIAIPFTIASAAAVAKGAVLKLADPATVSAHAAALDVFGGIVKVEKVATNTITQIALYRGGHFSMRTSGNITAGDAVVLDADINTVKAATSDNPAGAIVGLATEDSTTGHYQRIEVRPGVAQPFI